AGLTGLCLTAIECLRRVRAGVLVTGSAYFDSGFCVVAVVTAICLLRPNSWVRVLAGIVSISIWTYCGSFLVVLGGSLGPLFLSTNCLGIALAAYTIMVVWHVRPHQRPTHSAA
ncbi:MAG TPA: hypothetical protein VNH84_21910, partial [Candidatus Saccharimonadales bacterium]|nr:hypothetical protein [Candidatus Saccharimonadales bacterium]